MVERNNSKAITVRISLRLHREISDLVAVTGTSFQSFVEDGLNHVVATKLVEGGRPLIDAIKAVRAFRCGPPPVEPTEEDES